MRRAVCSKSRLLVSVLMLSLGLVGRLEASGSWSSTGGLSTARANHTATLLPDGRLLVTGGENAGGVLASAEIYDAHQGTWSSAGAMASSRRDHAAALLPDLRVLVTGGFNHGAGPFTPLDSAEIYDPQSNSWSSTSPMSTPRYGHTATLLPNGNVLVAGGYDGAGHLASAEVYNYVTGTWSTVASMSEARGNHTATLLLEGRVFVAGGWDLATNLGSPTAERFDPNFNIWFPAGSMSVARISHTATLLSDGTVLAAGGHLAGSEATYLASADIYDPVSGTWSTTGSMNTSRTYATATVLPAGTVLVAGGYFPDGGGYQDSAEIYVPSARAWAPTTSMSFGRALHTATPMFDGTVLVVGGVGNFGYLASAEVYTPLGDTTPPQIFCNAADGVWHATDVSISCAAIESESELANPADAHFTLTTTVATGDETANAGTDTRQVCNTENLCATAGPVNANKVDKKAPTISIASPVANATYQLNALVAASYTCTDGGSGVSSCQGPVASGSPIDTASTGTKTFTVNASDGIGGVGHVASASVTYSVVKGVGGGQTSADLSLTLTAPAKVTQGGTLTYSIAVTNRSNTTANGAVVSDALPPGTVFVSASTSQGSYTVSNGTVTVNLGSIAGNGTANISLNVTVTAPTGVTLTDTATVTATTPDLNPNNNSATKSTRVSR